MNSYDGSSVEYLARQLLGRVYATSLEPIGLAVLAANIMGIYVQRIQSGSGELFERLEESRVRL